MLQWCYDLTIFLYIHSQFYQGDKAYKTEIPSLMIY